MSEYAGDFEVHITVVPGEAELEDFLDWCRSQDCKCVWILLARGECVEQPMATWRRADTTFTAVAREARQRVDELARAGFAVARVKIEADPHNQNVPVDDADASAFRPTNYFEHHVKLLRDATAEREQLVQVCLRHGAHLSRNALRQCPAGREERFVTLRCHRVGRRTSETQLRQLLDELNELAEQVIDIESEYTVFDSNLALDAGWLTPA